MVEVAARRLSACMSFIAKDEPPAKTTAKTITTHVQNNLELKRIMISKNNIKNNGHCSFKHFAWLFKYFSFIFLVVGDRWLAVLKELDGRLRWCV